MQIECYAQRLLNPFRGVVHTIRYQSAEAVTTDGVEWDIYVANDALLDGLGRLLLTPSDLARAREALLALASRTMDAAPVAFKHKVTTVMAKERA